MNWINVNDRLPEIGLEVLVYSPDGGTYLAELNKPGVFYETTNGILLDKIYPITHWIPLPEKPL